MKKLLGIVVFSLVLQTNIAKSETYKGQHGTYERGTDKKTFCKSELKNKWNTLDQFCVAPSKYFKNGIEVMDGLDPSRSKAQTFPRYAIFINVTKSRTKYCKFIPYACLNDVGDGELYALVWNNWYEVEEVLDKIDPVRIAEKKRKEEEKRIADKKKEEEKKIADKKKKDKQQAIDLAATLYYWGLSTDKMKMYFFGKRNQNNLKGTMTIVDGNYLPWHRIYGIEVKDYERINISVNTKSGTSLEFSTKNSKKQKINLDFNNKTALLIDSEGNKSSLKLMKPEKLFASSTFDQNGNSDEKIKKKKPKSTPDDNKIVPAGSGSGFFVSKDGHAITNYHVIEGCDINKLSFKGSQNEVKVLAVDRVNDIAILKSDTKPDEIFPVSDEDVSLLEDVIVAGFPLGKQISSAIKTHKGVVTALAGAGDNYSFFQTDAAINQGNSGGPIINQKGNVVGIAVATWVEEGVQGVHFGIKSSTLKTFASANGLNFAPPNNRDLSNKDLGKLITKGTVYIECHMTIAKIKKMIAQAENRKAFFKEHK